MNNQRRNRKQLNYKLALFRFKESKYYPLFFYGSMLLLCLLLFIFAIIPLGENLFSVNKAVDQERQRIGILNQNLTYLSSLSDSDIQEKVILANALFPQSKDFNAAIQAIDSAALAANTTISNLTFTVGTLGGITPSIAVKEQMDLTIALQGSTASFVDFLQSLDQRVPLLNVEVFSISQNTATVQIRVAYQPYVKKTIDLESTLIAPAASTFSLLQNASDWKNQSAINPTASASAGNNLPPF